MVTQALKILPRRKKSPTTLHKRIKLILGCTPKQRSAIRDFKFEVRKITHFHLNCDYLCSKWNWVHVAPWVQTEGKQSSCVNWFWQSKGKLISSLLCPKTIVLSSFFLLVKHCYSLLNDVLPKVFPYSIWSKSHSSFSHLSEMWISQYHNLIGEIAEPKLWKLKRSDSLASS